MSKHLSRIIRLFAAALMLLVFSGAPAGAQSKQDEQKLKVVLDFWRVILNARHVELAPKYMAESYIQHDPRVGTGRAAFVEYFGRRPATPIQATLPTQPVKTFVQGDYVVLVWEREAPNPTDPSKTYKHYSFDMFRVTDGKLQEHWNDLLRTPPAPAPQK